MRRREFIAGLVGAAGWPAVGRPQQPIPTIGFLGLTSPEAFAVAMRGFHQGLSEAGYINGQNVAIDYRWAHGQFDQLPSLAAQLAQKQVNVIAALGTPASALAAKAATKTIPIIFVSGDDPVRIGLVAGLNQVSGNATGVYMLTASLEPKRLEILDQVVPKASVIAVIADPKSPDTRLQIKETADAAAALKRPIKIFEANTEDEIERSFGSIVQQRIGGVLLTSSPTYLALNEKVASLAARARIPTIAYFRAFAESGLLMTYGTSLIDAYRQGGVYTGRILKGERPSDLPVLQSVKIELVINLKTARTLDLTIPLPLLGRADEVIE